MPRLILIAISQTLAMQETGGDRVLDALPGRRTELRGALDEP